MIAPDTDFAARFKALLPSDQREAVRAFDAIRRASHDCGLIKQITGIDAPIQGRTTLAAAMFLRDWFQHEAPAVIQRSGGSIAFTLHDHLDGFATLTIQEAP